jgi:membrane protease YdiL (CAAX protease family)
MTAVDAFALEQGAPTPTAGAWSVPRAWTIGGAVVVVIGCVLLEARPLLVSVAAHPLGVLVALFALLLLVGATWPLAVREEGASAGRVAMVVAVGIAAFALGRLVGGGRSPQLATPALLAGNLLAAVAEEAFFRRLLYGLLEPAGTVWAVGGSAVLFAVVHVSSYGWWVLPLDLAAGLVLGWQRAATGSWRAPAITHVVVNLLVVI